MSAPIRQAINQVLLNRIKFIGENEQIYTGCPADLVKELTESVVAAAIAHTLKPVDDGR